MNFIIVLGNKLLPNGDLSQILINRLDKTYELYKTGKYDYIIVSGGKVGDSKYTEAYQMKRYLSELKIPVNKIIKEEISRNTIENAKECLKIINNLDVQKITVITSDFHLDRVKYIFKDFFENIIIEYVQSDNGFDENFLQKSILNEKIYLDKYIDHNNDL